MPSIFSNPNVMQMAGLAVMSGSRVGDAIKEAVTQDALMQQQAYQSQLMQQQQAEIEREAAARQAMMNTQAPQGVDPELWKADPATAMKLMEFQIRARGEDPAAVKLANEIQKARAAGDTQRMNDLLLSGKVLDKGIQMDASGNVVQQGGYAEAVSGIEGAKKQAEKTAEKVVLAESELASIESKMPNLYDTVNRLKELSQTATYTGAGKVKNEIRKQFGLKASESAVDRDEYVAIVDNQILPLLRDTFGAAFTQKEGEALRSTLGNPDATPEAKNRILDSFIKQKESDIASKRREISALTGENAAPSPVVRKKYNPVTGKIE